jgi:diaminopropionate ammonia-lyase
VTLDVLINPWRAGNGQARETDVGEPPALAFHRSLPGYAPTELLDSAELADLMNVRRVWLKIESERFGLPAFKILGASWAAERLMADRGADEDLCLVTATDGNHGRAVARVARMRGLRCRVFVPSGTAGARIAAIASEGANVEVIDGDYDTAVRRAARLADAEHVLLADTSWPGYENVPHWVVDGYSTMFAEVSEQLGGMSPDLAWIPIGVGSLAIAAARHWPGNVPRLVGFEPTGAACAFRSIEAGERTAAPGPHDSIMAGLNCGTLSLQAWPALRSRFDAFCSIGDECAEEGTRVLAEVRVAAGEVSGGAVGCALAVCRNDDARRDLRITSRSSLFLLLTEGVTDPQGWQRIVNSGSATPGRVPP